MSSLDAEILGLRQSVEGAIVRIDRYENERDHYQRLADSARASLDIAIAARDVARERIKLLERLRDGR